MRNRDSTAGKKVQAIMMSWSKGVQTRGQTMPKADQFGSSSNLDLMRPERYGRYFDIYRGKTCLFKRITAAPH